MRKNCVSYLRVSTHKQGRSGLGLEAQRTAVAKYLRAAEVDLLEEVVETESGKKSSRPSLQKALSLCRLHKATLVVAKVDRLTRSSSFLHQLLDAGVDIAFCDLPQLSGPTGKFMLNQMAAVAELEASLISERTKAALAAAKARGVVLGNPGNATREGRHKGQVRALEIRREQAERFNADVLPIAMEYKSAGMSLRKIAAVLNQRNITTHRGAQWTASQVRRLLQSSP